VNERNYDNFGCSGSYSYYWKYNNLILGLIKVEEEVLLMAAEGGRINAQMVTNMHLFHFDKADRWYNEFPGLSVFFVLPLSVYGIGY
jgi:hypothetical protein